MRNLLTFVSFALFAASASAQQIVSKLTPSSSLSCNTYAGHWEYINGGRSGWHWWNYLDQQTHATGVIPLNGSGVARAIGTWYQPNYLMTDYGSNSFINGPTAARFNVTLVDASEFMPLLGTNQDASVSAQSTQSVRFTITTTCNVKITVAGSGIAHMDDSGGSVIWSSVYGGNFSGPLPAGTYFVEIVMSASASKDTHTGTTLNWGGVLHAATMRIDWSPYSGG